MASPASPAGGGDNRAGGTSGAGRWVAGGVVIAGIAAAFAWYGTVTLTAPAKAAREYLKSNATKPDVRTTPSGLQIQVLRPGAGPTPGPTDLVLVHYEGKLVSGETFDSSYARQQPAAFRVADVVKGFGEGLQTMKVGGKSRFVIPPALGYGARTMGDGAIPANSVLIFDVELLAIAPPGAAPAAR